MDLVNLDTKIAGAVVHLPVAKAAKDGAESQQAERVNAEKTDASYAEIEQAVTAIETYTQSISRNLNFSLDESSGRVVVKVTDGSSGEVIRQIPSEDALKLAESLDQVRSLLFKAQA